MKGDISHIAFNIWLHTVFLLIIEKLLLAKYINIHMKKTDIYCKIRRLKILEKNEPGWGVFLNMSPIDENKKRLIDDLYLSIYLSVSLSLMLIKFQRQK
jgi:hypothetical protein